MSSSHCGKKAMACDPNTALFVATDRSGARLGNRKLEPGQARMASKERKERTKAGLTLEGGHRKVSEQIPTLYAVCS